MARYQWGVRGRARSMASRPRSARRIRRVRPGARPAVPGAFDAVERLLGCTRDVVVATGILNVWAYGPTEAAEAHALRRAFDVTGLPTLDEQRPDERPPSVSQGLAAALADETPTDPDEPVDGVIEDDEPTLPDAS